MIEEKFTVLHDDNSVFINHSFLAKDYDTAAFPLVIISADDRILIGLDKLFNSFFPQMETVNTNAGTFTAKYFDKDDQAFKALTIQDETLMFTQSGFIFFDKPKDTDNNNLWEANTINGIKKFWLQLVPSVDFSVGTEVRGLSVLFSNDADLTRSRSNIVTKHAQGQQNDSWILKHVEARDEIIQRIRNAGNKKVKLEDIDGEGIFESKDITRFDFHDIDQLRQASKYFALTNIFRFELSDEKDDKYELLARKYEKKASNAMNVFFLKIDFNDDGIEDTNESTNDTRIELSFD